MVARAYGKSLTDDEIEDIYSAAWAATLAALRDRGSEMSEHELRAYVLTAVASHASKELRRRSRKPTGPLDDMHGLVVADLHEPLPEERVIGSESQGIARDLLSSLPVRRRAVMLLRYGWGLSPEEVCGLVSGLSRRAYRKEISRGVEQLIERLGEVESGDWCRSRQALLRDYFAGTADEDVRLQVEQHLAHCRACGQLASQVRDQLNDLGGVVVLGAAAGLISSARPSIVERIDALIQGGRDNAAALAEKAELTAGTVSASGGAKGAGAAGAGLAAKFAGLGGAGKTALACLGAGAAATACVAVGVVPGVTIADLSGGRESAPKQARSEPVPREPAQPTIPDGPPASPSTPTPSRRAAGAAGSASSERPAGAGRRVAGAGTRHPG